MEKELGIQLLDRCGKSFTLTEEGKKNENLSHSAKEYLAYLRERKAEDFIRASLKRKFPVSRL